MVKRERDDFMNQNEILRNQLEEHENIVNSLHQHLKVKLRRSFDTDSHSLKVRISILKAMAEALESQLSITIHKRGVFDINSLRPRKLSLQI
jgi:nucleoid DNA-binding protein